MADQSDRLGSSGVFKVLVEGARKVKRALSESEAELSPQALELGNAIAQAFIAGRFSDVHRAGTPGFQERTTHDRFVASWREAVRARGPLTGFEVSNAGQIDLGFIPGLEETPQSHFVGFLEVAFSSPGITLEDEKAFTVGAVLLDEGGGPRIGALHLR